MGAFSIIEELHDHVILNLHMVVGYVTKFFFWNKTSSIRIRYLIKLWIDKFTVNSFYKLFRKILFYYDLQSDVSSYIIYLEKCVGERTWYAYMSS